MLARGDPGVVRVLDLVCERAKFAEVTQHTLRRAFASLAGHLGLSELTIAALLEPASRGVTQSGVHIDAALRTADDRVSEQMADILEGKATIVRPCRRGGRQWQEVR